MLSPKILLTRHGLAAHKDLGQNFLADPSVARAIVRAAGLGPGHRVLEIGPGLGALTQPLLENGCLVTAVELDRGLADLLEAELLPLFPDRLSIIRSDILKVDLPALAAEKGGPLHVVSNLPYQISSPVLVRLVEARQAVADAVLMFQSELAERLTAGPGGRDYGRLSVLLGYYAGLTRLLELGPEVFYPRPKVRSTVLGLRFKASPEPALESDARFRQVVAAAFSRRRKTLRNAPALGLRPGGHWPRACCGRPGRRTPGRNADH